MAERRKANQWRSDSTPIKRAVERVDDSSQPIEAEASERKRGAFLMRCAREVLAKS